ncbi:MAG: family 10 endo-beta-xylanase [Phycisphaerales bacterium]|nr:family 10 endo-beta-xylanase [Phycisphaerales bacterium]
MLVLTLGGPAARSAPPDVTLQSAADGSFKIGAAITSAQLKDPKTASLILSQFNAITPEFELFPQFVHPEPDRYTFERADAVVDFAVENHLPVTGHMLCWGQFTPAWMFQDAGGQPLSRDKALANLKAHIDAVVSHFKNRVHSWDVVNEAISDTPNEYLRDTPARRAIGDDYVQKAFEFARAADPTATLFYNDYNIEDPQKLPKVLRLLRSLKAAGVTVDAVGIQGHWLIDFPAPAVIDKALRALEAEHLPVLITELDIDPLPRRDGADLANGDAKGADPYAAGLPAEVSRKLAMRYGEVFSVLKRHAKNVTSVTLWGVNDRQSWLNDFPVKGRTNYPLLFDRDLRPKEAFNAVLGVLKAP